jgi:hypothetical protein
MSWFQAAYWTVGGACLSIALLLLLQTLEHCRYARSRGRRIGRKAPDDAVALFVPCKGNDSDLEANLRPMFAQDHPNYELAFIVESLTDDAYTPIQRLIAEHPNQRARIVVAGLATDSGQKVHNLLVATKHLPPGVKILAFADADIRPPQDWLRLLTQQLHRLTASTGYRRFVPKRVTLANLIVASIDTAVVPIMFPCIHHKVWGGSWAIRREVFENGQMRDAWQGTLSDDLVASNVLARMKQPLALECACILPSPIDVDMRTMLAWVRRQFIIGRFYSPYLWAIVAAGHCFSQLVFWSSAAAALVGIVRGANWWWQPAAFVGVMYGLQVLRGWLRQAASRIYLPDSQQALRAARLFDIWCGPIASAALFGALVGSAIGRRITWKNNVYEMSYGGQIRKLPPSVAHADAASAAPRKAA